MQPNSQRTSGLCRYLANRNSGRPRNQCPTKSTVGRRNDDVLLATCKAFCWELGKSSRVEEIPYHTDLYPTHPPTYLSSLGSLVLPSWTWQCLLLPFLVSIRFSFPSMRSSDLLKSIPPFPFPFPFPFAVFFSFSFPLVLRRAGVGVAIGVNN